MPLQCMLYISIKQKRCDVSAGGRCAGAGKKNSLFQQFTLNSFYSLSFCNISSFHLNIHTVTACVSINKYVIFFLVHPTLPLM